MRKFFLLCTVLLLFTSRGATQNECRTKVPAKPLLIDQNLLEQNNKTLAGPITVKVFIHRIAFDPPTEYFVAGEESDILDNFEYARQFWAPQGICLILQGMDTIQNYDLVSMNDESTTEIAMLENYLVPDALNIFIHFSFEEEGVLGTAYRIPNNYISLHENYTWGGFRMLMAHELGHCFGLYHTFETAYGQERVVRSGNCTNCTTVGDLLCDTEADVKEVTSSLLQNCVYTGTLKDSCNTTYKLTPKNLMSYHYSETCLDHFTAQQGERARYFLNNDPVLTPLVLTADNLVRTTNATISNGARIFYTYRNSISIEAANYTVQQGGQLQMASKEVTVKPGATFTPGPTGEVAIRGFKCQ